MPDPSEVPFPKADPKPGKPDMPELPGVSEPTTTPTEMPGGGPDEMPTTDVPEPIGEPYQDPSPVEPET